MKNVVCDANILIDLLQVDLFNAFLKLKWEVHVHAGRISHEMSREMAEAEYEKFHRRRIREKDRQDNDFEKTVKQLTDGKRGKKK